VPSSESSRPRLRTPLDQAIDARRNIFALIDGKRFSILGYDILNAPKFLAPC
jgi:hypothetical protein